MHSYNEYFLELVLHCYISQQSTKLCTIKYRVAFLSTLLGARPLLSSEQKTCVSVYEVLYSGISTQSSALRQKRSSSASPLSI